MAHKIRDNQYVGVSRGTAHYFEISGRGASGDEASQTKEDFNRWKENPIDIGNYKVIPFGSNNDLPNELQETIFPNHLAPRIQNRKVELLFGQGPYLYSEKSDGKQFYRVPEKDKEILSWLESIDYIPLLIQRGTEYYYADQIYGKIRRARGGRLGRANAIASLEPLQTVNCRLAYHRNNLSEIPTHVIIGDWSTRANNRKDFEVLPLWDRNNPTKHPVAVHFTGFKSFGLSDYTLPSIYGSLNWIKRSTTAPKIIEAFTNNSLNVRFHITSPQKFWDDQREIMKKNCQSQGIPFKEKMMEDLEDEIFDSLSEVLSGVENVGKFWHNKTVVQLIGGQATEQGWKITPIKQEVKEYVEAQIAVADKSDFAVQAGLGLHASLANVGADGKSDSGSEQLYAHQIHQLSGTPIPELYVCKAFNDIIKIKFNRNIKLGFYYTTAKREQDVSESNRMTNTTL